VLDRTEGQIDDVARLELDAQVAQAARPIFRVNRHVEDFEAVGGDVLHDAFAAVFMTITEPAQPLP
jgi:hypothetical protein